MFKPAASCWSGSTGAPFPLSFDIGIADRRLGICLLSYGPEEKMNPEEVALAIGSPVQSWYGNCFAIATKMVDAGLVEGTPVYGHWLGPVDEEGFFGPRKGMDFQHHGWILRPDGTIVDPTRWVFENVEPYIYEGENDHYDEGGNNFLEETMGEMPPFDPEEAIEGFTFPQMEQERWSIRQVMWVANLPYHLLWDPYGTYKKIEEIGFKAFVPIDNWRRAERETEV